MRDCVLYSAIISFLIVYLSNLYFGAGAIIRTDRGSIETLVDDEFFLIKRE